MSTFSSLTVAILLTPIVLSALMGCASPSQQQVKRQHAASQAVLQESKIRAVIQNYVVGSTTLDQFHADRKSGGWQIHSAQGHVVQDKDLNVVKFSPVVFVVGTPTKAVCELSFEGNDANPILKSMNCK